MSESHSGTILVVDDNPATLYATTRVLRAGGYEVREAGNGQTALERAAANVDLIVLDVNLPDFSGFEVCKRLRASAATARVPIIHLSATFVKDVDKVAGYEVGADGYLTHPVEPPVLLATVNAFLRARRAEDATRQSDARFRAIVDNAPSGIALLDSQLVQVEVNSAMARMLGRDSDDLVGRSVIEFFGDAGPQVAAALAANGWWRGRSTVPGSQRRVELDWNITRHSVPGLFLAIVNDISELTHLEDERAHLLASERTARAEAERANRHKDEFLATVAHDLRTPLAAIVNYAQALRHGPVTPPQRDGLQAIERNALVAVQLIADLLDISRITSGKLHLDLQAIDVVQLVEGAVETSRGTAAARKVALRCSGAPAARWVVGDPARLQQVVWNLVSNGLKFTPAGGSVDVELRDAAGAVEIIVRDDGRGIPPSLLPHVFDRFRQGPAGVTPHTEGLGLGLSIVLHIVETHQGTVRAASDGEGRGATFVVRLPATVERPSRDQWGMPVAPSGQALVRLEGVRVLVVDDDDDSRELVDRIVREHGAEVRTAASVDEALRLVESFAPRVLVSDIGMPERDGYDLVRAVRASGRSAAVLPAIAVTAYANAAERQRALATGFQLHLTKPVSATALLAGIVRLASEVGAGSSGDATGAT